MRNIIHILSRRNSNCIDQNIYTRLELADKSKKTEDALYFTWGGSVVKHGSTYYMAVCRWLVSGGITNWTLDSKIVLATSSTLEGPYTGFTEITETRGEPWSQTSAFNPRFYVHNGVFYLFYTGTNGVTHDEALENQRLGVIYTSDFITWHYGVNPVVSPRPGEWDALFTNNPAVYRSSDGKFSMIYKSKETLPDDFAMGIAQSGSLIDGWESVSDEPILNGRMLEDANVWYEGCKYYMIARGFEVGENGILFESIDGLNWIESDNELAFDFDINWTDSTSDTYDRVEGPYIYRENNVAMALFTCCYDGAGSFNICRLLSDPN